MKKSDNPSVGDDGAIFLAFLTTDTYLKNLNMSHKKIGDTGANALAQALMVNNTLTGVYLPYNQIGDTGAIALAKALMINKTLTALYLPYNQIGDEGALFLAAALTINTSLQYLDLTNNQIRDEGANMLAEALKTNTTLQNLSLTSNQIGYAGTIKLAEALMINKTLTELYLSGNKIGDAGAIKLAAALKTNTYLQILDLSGNKIGDAGAIKLADALKINTYLKNLNLSRNQIEEEGAIALEKALTENISLTELYLPYNPIGDKGAEHLAIILMKNKKLKSLGVKGAKNLELGLLKNTTLEALDVYQDKKVDMPSDEIEIAIALATVLKTNNTLKHLFIEYIGRKGAEALLEALKTNTSLLTLQHNMDDDKYIQDLIRPIRLRLLYNKLLNLPIERSKANLQALKDNGLEDFFTEKEEELLKGWADKLESRFYKHSITMSEDHLTSLIDCVVPVFDPLPEKMEDFKEKLYLVFNGEKPETLIPFIQNQADTDPVLMPYSAEGTYGTIHPIDGNTKEVAKKVKLTGDDEEKRETNNEFLDENLTTIMLFCLHKKLQDFLVRLRTVPDAHTAAAALRRSFLQPFPEIVLIRKTIHDPVSQQEQLICFMGNLDRNSRAFFNDDSVAGVDKISLLIQICNLLYCLQESCGFTHGDMRDKNIMVRKEDIGVDSAINPKMHITSKYRPYFIDLGMACADLSRCCNVKHPRYVANGIYDTTDRCKNKSQDMRLYLFTLFTLYTTKDAKAKDAEKADDKENELKTYLTGLFKKKDCIFSRSIPIDLYEEKQTEHKESPSDAFYKDTETINDTTFYPENIFYDLMQLLMV